LTRVLPNKLTAAMGVGLLSGTHRSLIYPNHLVLLPG